MSQDTVPAIKILYLEIVVKLKDFAIVDDEIQVKVLHSIAQLREDTSPEFRSRAEALSYDIMQWKKQAPREEIKEVISSREAYESKLQIKEQKEEEKRKKQEEEDNKSTFMLKDPPRKKKKKFGTAAG